MNWIDVKEKEKHMLIIILKKYKMHIKMSIKKSNNSSQSTKGNNKRIKYKINRFSCINLYKANIDYYTLVSIIDKYNKNSFLSLSYSFHKSFI